MGTEDRPAESGQGRRKRSGEKLADWADGRLGLHRVVRATMRKAFPDHWSYMLGEICVYSFLVIILTGVYLTFYFHPSSAQVTYDGSYAPLRGQLVSEAFDSTMDISFDVRGGLLIRQAHHWAALVFVAAVLVHMMRVFFTGAFRRPREVNWLLGFSLLVLAMFAGLTGYDLPDDQLSGTGLAIVNGTLLSTPIIGSYLSFFLFGGDFPGNDLVPRFNTIHILVIPGIMAAVVVAHLALLLYHKHTQFAGPGRTKTNVVGPPVQVYAVKSAGYFFMVAGVIFIAAAIAQINPIWRYGPYRPDQVSAGSQPDWYMGVADGLLRVMPGWELNFWGHTLALDNFLPLMAGVCLFLAMGVYPFIEAWVTGDDREQNLLDRPRDRPVRTGLGVAWLSVYVVALLGAANDLIATHFRLSVNTVTWAVRFGLFVVPVLAYIVAKRCALGLQRRDREKVLHGRETGVVKRLSYGEFVEVHEPLTREQLHSLTAHQQYKPLPAGTEQTTNGGRAWTRRLRVKLSRGYYGENAQITKPTPREYEEITSGH
ncbi:cytochrome bc complex cytochrome b subunit [Streptomyces sp. NBC_01725]|uniref:cytochrome bc1 complex cytochrome b subunit n=1 Tax=Streptomyces sp. NBC_01725 TaxID=2975923 RepID=UPI002E2A887C|nr:cytochrome bc complex cytochrome b subunit [Streptomyces sp. NBC_01725]